MDASLGITESSLNAERTAIGVTAENISNAQTPGYVRESVALSPLPGGDLEGVGDGVAVTSVAQATNAMLAANNYQAQGALANLSAAQETLTGIENVFPLGQSTQSSSSTTTSGNSSIAGQLADFWSAWDGIVQDPSALAPRTQVVDDAQGLVTSLNEASTQLGQLATNDSAELQTQIGETNTLLSQAASLNGSILVTSGGGGDPAQLEDQLNSVLGQLSSLAGVSIQTQTDGTATISIGGVAVVQGTQSSTLSTTTTGSTTSVISSIGNVAVPVSSGSIAGLLTGVNQYIPQYQSALDGVANSLSSMVNTQLAAGYTSSGTSGSTEPLFTGGGAANIAVNADVVADPTLLAASSVTGAAGANDAGNAQAMAELGSSTTGPDASYQNLVQSIGSATENVNTQVEAQTSVANQAQSALQSATGVNLDTELTNLMSFQQAYEASAKLITTISTTMESLISAV